MYSWKQNFEKVAERPRFSVRHVLPSRPTWQPWKKNMFTFCVFNEANLSLEMLRIRPRHPAGERVTESQRGPFSHTVGLRVTGHSIFLRGKTIWAHFCYGASVFAFRRSIILCRHSSVSFLAIHDATEETRPALCSFPPSSARSF